MSITLQQFGIDQLNTQQRLELISLIWDSLPEDAPFVLSESHIRELDRRIAIADANPDASEPWEVVLERLKRKT